MWSSRGRQVLGRPPPWSRPRSIRRWHHGATVNGRACILITAASAVYQDCLSPHGLTQSMGQVRTCADNASAESVFSQMMRELGYHRRVRTRREAIDTVDGYFLKVDNPRRQMSLNRAELAQRAKLDVEARRNVNGFDSLT